MVKFYLHDAVYLWYIPFHLPVIDDAVYLYLRTVNQMLAEGNSNYRDGRLILKRTIGQRFAGERFRQRTTFLLNYRSLLYKSLIHFTIFPLLLSSIFIEFIFSGRIIQKLAISKVDQR